MSMSNLDLSVIVPVYRSETTLRELHERLSRTLRESGLSYEIVLVDDASPDNSWSVMKQLRGRRPPCQDHPAHA